MQSRNPTKEERKRGLKDFARIAPKKQKHGGPQAAACGPRRRLSARHFRAARKMTRAGARQQFGLRWGARAKTNRGAFEALKPSRVEARRLGQDHVFDNLVRLPKNRGAPPQAAQTFFDEQSSPTD